MIRVAKIKKDTQVSSNSNPLSDNLIRLLKICYSFDLAKVNRELIVNGMINENQSTVAVHQNRTKAITKISELRVPYED